MQRILTILCIGSLLLFTHPKAHAQEQLPEKKNLIGAGLSFSTSKADVNVTRGNLAKATTFSIPVTYVHYLKKNVGLGVNLVYSHTKQDYVDVDISDLLQIKNNGYSFSPFVRFDVPLWQSRFTVFNDLGIGGFYGETHILTDTGDNASYNWELSAFYSPGLMFRLKSNISLQLSYGALISYSYNEGGGVKNHSFGVLKDQKIGDLRFGVNFLF